MAITRRGWAAIGIVAAGAALAAGIGWRADLERRTRDRAELVAVAADPVVAEQAQALNREASGYHVRPKGP